MRRGTEKNFLKTNEKRLQEIILYVIIFSVNDHGLVVKRLRRRPLTAQSRVRFPARSPNKLKANPFPLGDGFAFIVYFR